MNAFLRVVLVHFESDDVTKIEVHYRDVDGSEKKEWFRYPELPSTAYILKRLVERGADLDIGCGKTKEKLRKSIRSLERKCRVSYTNTSGWRGTGGFVLPGYSFGSAEDKVLYRPSAASARPGLGQRSGTLKGWQKHVAKPAMASSFMMFGIMLALAAPLCRRYPLSETAIFNLFGESSSGKTTAVKVAFSVIGAPSSPPSWNATHRALEELAFQHNDMLMLLDDMENMRGSQVDRFRMLRDAAHALTDGQSKHLSQSVADQNLHQLNWMVFALSTTPRSLQALAASAKAEITEGDLVRFLGLRLPRREEGGVFDRLDQLGVPLSEAPQLIDKLETGIQEHHGVVFASWLEHLMEAEVQDEIQRAQEKFLAKRSKSGNPLLIRIAKKFAIIYAAGIVASRRNLLPWSQKDVGNTVRHVYALAIKNLEQQDDEWRNAIKILHRKARIKWVFPAIPNQGQCFHYDGKVPPGFRGKCGKKTCLFARRELLEELWNYSENIDAILKVLRSIGVILQGHGDSLMQQVRVSDRNGTKSKPRYYVFSRSNLRKYAEE